MKAFTKIIIEQKKIKRQEIYKDHNRFIDPILYNKLKKVNKCQQCKIICRVQIHHKIPVSKGGNNEEENLQCLCRECHKKKHLKK